MSTSVFANHKGMRHAVFATVIAILLFPLPVLVLVMQSGLVDPSVPADAWLQEPVLGAIHAVTGLPAWMPLFLLSMLAGALAWALPAAFERIARRIDPDDRAWTSFTWALRSWRGALRWLALVLLPTLTLGAAWMALVRAGFVQEPEPSASGLRILVFLSVSFFVLDARNYIAGEPPRRWSARWPTRPVWFLLAAMFVVIGLLCRFGAPALIRWLQTGSGSGMWKPVIFLLAFKPAELLVSWTIGLAWLGRAPSAGLRSTWRRGLRPRVLATSALQWLRPALYVGLALLPVVAWAWLFVDVVPQAEETVRTLHPRCFSCCTACTGSDRFWEAMIDVSRWLVAWWWAAGIGALILLSAALDWLAPWFGDVAWARLMVEMGVVDAPTPQTRPDCDPAATTPPTA